MSSARRASALALAAVAVATLSAPPASAGVSQCPDGYSCVWTDSNYSSSYSGRGNANYTEYYAVGGRIFNDSISSIYNRFPGWKTWYEHADRGGAKLMVYGVTRISNLQDRSSGVWYHPDWNDFISSVD